MGPRIEPPRDLRVLRRERACGAGRSEVCREGGGTRWLRLCALDGGLQRELLSTLDRRSAARVRVERGAVELLFPSRGEGESLRRWLYRRRPGLGERRDACLSLLGSFLEDRPPPAVLALAAEEGNLRFSASGEAWLEYLPDWSGRWDGLREEDAVRSASALLCTVLTRGMEERRFPPELRLILLRSERSGYAGWDQLGRDLSALPDALPGPAGPRLAREADRWTRRWRRPAAGLLAAAMVLAALVSMAAAFQEWRSGRARLFQGMTPVGTQELE